MDFVSHALWGGVAFGRKNRRYYIWAAIISILPDILTEGLFGALYLLKIGGMPGWENGHPNITDYPIYAQNLYNITHSLIVFGVVFLLIYAITKKIPWLMCGWGLHILIDIPTHSMALFPTPFLWPITNFKINGIGWDSPVVLTIDVILLIAAYSSWLYFVKHHRR